MEIIHHITVVLAILGSTPIGCHGIPVSPEDPPLGTLHRTFEHSELPMLGVSTGIRL